jgi:opacity protein-like surface antigen
MLHFKNIHNIKESRMFKKKWLLLVLTQLAPFCLAANAEIMNHPYPFLDPQNGHFYLGVFGGGGSANNASLTQKGTAFFPPSRGGPLAVNAHGNADNNSAGMGGAHIGYEWQKLFRESSSNWNLIPAVELEGYYLGMTQTGALLHPTPRLPKHDFYDTFPMNTGVLLGNSVWAINIPSTNWVNPYVGVGLGVSYISISDANSKQVAPAEPGINHFNSNPDASDWAFAAQAKAGLRFILNPHWRLLAEYRFLYVASTNYTFGSTQYPTHVPTTKWHSSIGYTDYNMGVAGIEYAF